MDVLVSIGPPMVTGPPYRRFECVESSGVDSFVPGTEMICRCGMGVVERDVCGEFDRRTDPDFESFESNRRRAAAVL